MNNQDVCIKRINENTFELYISGYLEFKKRITTLQLVEIIKEISNK